MGSRHALPLPSSSVLPVATGDYPTFGNAADFSWVAGRLDYQLACSYIVFRDARQAPWGGRLPLIDSASLLQQLPEGDAIVVKGQLARLGAGRCGAPAYIVHSVEEH